MKIFLSPSKLEKFRDVVSGTWGATPSDFRDYCLRRQITTEAMERGKAYHTIIEKGSEVLRADNDAEIVSGPYLFHFSKEAVELGLNVHQLYNNMLHEVWLNHTMQVKNYDVNIRMRCDGVDGLELHEFKTTGTAKQWLDYEDSLQWRCYQLAMPEIQKVCYHIFHFGVKNDWCRYNCFSYCPGPIEETERLIKSWIEKLIDWSECDAELMAALIK